LVGPLDYPTRLDLQVTQLYSWIGLLDGPLVTLDLYSYTPLTLRIARIWIVQFPDTRLHIYLVVWFLRSQLVGCWIWTHGWVVWVTPLHVALWIGFTHPLDYPRTQLPFGLPSWLDVLGHHITGLHCLPIWMDPLRYLADLDLDFWFLYPFTHTPLQLHLPSYAQLLTGYSGYGLPRFCHLPRITHPVAPCIVRWIGLPRIADCPLPHPTLLGVGPHTLPRTLVGLRCLGLVGYVGSHIPQVLPRWIAPCVTDAGPIYPRLVGRYVGFALRCLRYGYVGWTLVRCLDCRCYVDLVTLGALPVCPLDWLPRNSQIYPGWIYTDCPTRLPRCLVTLRCPLLRWLVGPDPVAVTRYGAVTHIYTHTPLQFQVAFAATCPHLCLGFDWTPHVGAPLPCPTPLLDRIWLVVGYLPFGCCYTRCPRCWLRLDSHTHTHTHHHTQLLDLGLTHSCTFGPFGLRWMVDCCSVVPHTDCSCFAFPLGLPVHPVPPVDLPHPTPGLVWIAFTLPWLVGLPLLQFGFGRLRCICMVGHTHIHTHTCLTHTHIHI